MKSFLILLFIIVFASCQSAHYVVPSDNIIIYKSEKSANVFSSSDVDYVFQFLEENNNYLAFEFSIINKTVQPLNINLQQFYYQKENMIRYFSIHPEDVIQHIEKTITKVNLYSGKIPPNTLTELSISLNKINNVNNPENRSFNRTKRLNLQLYNAKEFLDDSLFYSVILNKNETAKGIIFFPKDTPELIEQVFVHLKINNKDIQIPFKAQYLF